MDDNHTDTFSAVAALITLVIDAKATKQRLAELQAQMDAVAAAEAKLAGERDAHNQAVANATAALDAREKKVRQREVDVAAREGELRHGQQVLADAKQRLERPRDPNLGGTLTRGAAA
jgi:hypothetical protein